MGIGPLDMSTTSGGLAMCFFFSSRRRHTRLQGDWSSDVCSSDLVLGERRHMLGHGIMFHQKFPQLLSLRDDKINRLIQPSRREIDRANQMFRIGDRKSVV